MILHKAMDVGSAFKCQTVAGIRALFFSASSVQSELSPLVFV